MPPLFFGWRHGSYDVMCMKHLQRVLLILFVVWPHAGQAQQVDEFGRQIVDIANRYTAAISAAKLCGQYKFNDKAQEQDFNSNRELSRLYASRIFIIAYPGKPLAALIAQAEKMDRDMSAKIAGLHADKGCSDEVMQVFLKWFQGMKKLSRMPYPKPDISENEFRAMAKRWQKLSSQPR